jgi:choline dehydrogenase-like flavoprotein
MFMFRNLHAALGLINLNFHDTRRDENFVTLETGVRNADPALSINYTPRFDERASIQKGLRKVKRALRKLKCIVPPGMVHVRPMGASVHYSGTIPMSKTKSAYTTSEYCQSHDFDNLFIVDGSTFPFLPAKNITYTLMSNAVRVAEHAF